MTHEDLDTPDPIHDIRFYLNGAEPRELGSWAVPLNDGKSLIIQTATMHPEIGRNVLQSDAYARLKEHAGLEETMIPTIFSFPDQDDLFWGGFMDMMSGSAVLRCRIRLLSPDAAASTGISMAMLALDARREGAEEFLAEIPPGRTDLLQAIIETDFEED